MFKDDKLLEKRAEQQEDFIDLLAKREHLKRQYLHFYKMRKKVKDKQIEEKIERYKRQILRMIGRD